VLIPGFDLIKKTAMEKRWVLEYQDLGLLFSLSKRKTLPTKSKAMSTVYDEMKLPYEIHVSKVNPDGIRIL
jgi:homoserine kinase